jgi:carboxyl-terminal processing protease
VFGQDNHDGRVFARDVPVGLPAARAGLRVGDEVVAIDGRAVQTMTPDQVDEAFRGPAGTVVVLRVHRHGDEMDIPIKREASQ